MYLRVNIQHCFLPNLSQSFDIRAAIDMKRDNLFYREIREVSCFQRKFTRQNLQDSR